MKNKQSVVVEYDVSGGKQTNLKQRKFFWRIQNVNGKPLNMDNILQGELAVIQEKAPE